jgi:hypothetical protein
MLAHQGLEFFSVHLFPVEKQLGPGLQNSALFFKDVPAPLPLTSLKTTGIFFV